MAANPQQPQGGGWHLPQFVEASSSRVVCLGVNERLIDLAMHIGGYSKGLFGLPCIITSGRDECHEEGGKHGRGDAIDIRSKDKSPEQLAVLLTILHYICPSFGVAVHDHSADDGKEHIHLELY